jgi:eukaryotic-like serine/threonine-protein kinase
MSSTTVSVPLSVRSLRLVPSNQEITTVSAAPLVSHSVVPDSSAAMPPSLRGSGYRVGEPLCAGGMGQLYRASHAALGRQAVLKVLHQKHVARADYATRLRREARILARLSGRHTPVVFDSGTLADGRPYFVMEHLAGSDLESEISRHGVLSVPSAVRVTIELLRALAEVHHHGIVHRDVKLANVFLCDDGRVVLLDFGVAQIEEETMLETAPGFALGTPRTMAPEQINCEDADARSDVYAAGLVLYELLTGEGPFDDVASSVHGLRVAHNKRQPPRPNKRSPQPIPDVVERIVLRALSKKPALRFACARDMASALATARKFPFDREDDPTIVDD